MWSWVQSVWHCSVCERVIFSICRHTQQVHTQISKRPSCLNTCLYKKIKENSMIGRPNHSKQKSSVLQWAGISQGTSVKRISCNKLGAWLPCCSHIFFHEAKEQLAERRAPRRTYGLLYFLPCTVEMSECHKECSYSVWCGQQLKTWSTIATVLQNLSAVALA